ncbi:hypothetical protein FPOAC2_06239 [Fusarium poae]|jgi:hypothetical protein|uniref:hypothetical protein n=1 Tax=Fusarium poae TaxID=36050 RepID=UPI001CE7DE63|nr:hypothetical protein FPOAC1_006123 [Fusarium poae]KAG8672831.1 hypothetical protein FPOAC1_006123 [Fusarium poae]
MPRRQTFDRDEGRLPAGMKRVGYDSDTGVYTFQAADGTLWEMSPGTEYGQLKRAGGNLRADSDFRRRNLQFFGTAHTVESSTEVDGEHDSGPEDLDDIVPLPRYETSRYVPPARYQYPRYVDTRRATAPPRVTDVLQRRSSRLESLRQRVKSVKTSLVGSVNKTLEEVKSAFRNT